MSNPAVKQVSPSQQKHRKEFLWQVLLPLFGGIGVVLLFMAVSVSSTVNQSLWADISLIWLILPILFLALVSLLLLAAMIYGLAKLTNVLPRYTLQVQGFFLLLKMKVSGFDDRLVSPLIKLKVSSAKFGKLKAQFREGHHGR